MIVAWDDEQIAGMDRYGVARVVTELDSAGRVMREIGFASTDEVIYCAPVAEGRFSWLFDGDSVDLSDPAALSAMTILTALEFEILWQSAVDVTRSQIRQQQGFPLSTAVARARWRRARARSRRGSCAPRHR